MSDDASKNSQTAMYVMIAVLLLGLWIYFIPLMFIGFVLGIWFEMNVEKIKVWIDDASAGMTQFINSLLTGNKNNEKGNTNEQD